MFDYTNVNPLIPRGPDKRPLQLEVQETQFNPLPSGGLVSDAMFGPVRSIDPTTKFSPDAWAVRQQEEDTWGEVSDIELALSGAGGNADSFGNVPGAFIEWATGVKVPKLFNDPSNGAIIKALYLNRSPVDRIKWGDSSFSEAAIKEAQTTLGLLWEQEPAGLPVDSNNPTENQKKIKEITDYLVYAEARKRSYLGSNYSFADYFAATSKDTPGIFGSQGGPWNWVTEQIGKYYGSGTEMPKDMEDLNKVFSRKDPYFDYQTFWAKAMENPIVQEGILDNGGSIDVIRRARNEDEANYLLNKALVNSHLQKRLAVYEANANVLKKTFGGAVNIGVGMVIDPSTAPLTLATVGTGLLARGGVSVIGHAGKSAAPIFGIKLTEGVLKTGRAIGMTTEALVTLPLGGAPIYAHNLNVLARLGFTTAGGSLVAGAHDIYIQNQQIAYAAAMQYSDPDAQTEFDSSRMFSAFGHGALAGSMLFLGGATLSSLFGAVGNRVLGVKKTVELPLAGSTLKVAIRNPLDRRLSIEGTTLGEIANTFGTIKGKLGTMFDRSPAEKIQIESLNDGTNPTPERLVTETNDQVNRSAARTGDTPDRVNNTPEESLNKRLDNETRTQYARRMGLSKALTNPREFLSELGRKTAADVDANDNIGIDGTDMTNVSPTTRARILIDAEQRIKDAQQAETEAVGGTLAADRLEFYKTLEKYRKTWLTNTLRKLTKVERQEFYKAIRGEPVDDRVNTARNNTIDSATRNAAADSVAAQLLAAAREDRASIEVSDAAVKAAFEEAKLENKVAGTISNETAKYIVNIIKNGTAKGKSKIGKVIEASLRELRNNGDAVRKIREVSKNKQAFLQEAKGNKNNIKQFYDFVLDLESKGLIQNDDVFVLLLAALDFDFNSRAFTDIKYEVVDSSVLNSRTKLNDGVAGVYDFTTKTLQISNANESWYTSRVVLHELGHAGVANIFGTKSYIQMLTSYINAIDSEPIGTLGIQSADPVFGLLTDYHMSNAEEMLVESYAIFSLALNQKKFSEALLPVQRDYIRTAINVVLKALTKTALGVDNSSYFATVQPLINELQAMEASIVGPSVVDIHLDVLDVLTNTSTKFNRSKLKLNSNELLEVQNFTSYYEALAFAFLKGENKTLINSKGLLTDSFKDFHRYLLLLQEAEVASKVVSITTQIKQIITSADGLKSEAEIKKEIKDLFFVRNLQKNLPAAYPIYQALFHKTEVNDILWRYGTVYVGMGKTTLSLEAQSQILLDPRNNFSVRDELIAIFYETGLPSIANLYSANYLLDVDIKLTDKQLKSIDLDKRATWELLLRSAATRKSVSNYSRSPKVPHTREALVLGLEAIKENEAAKSLEQLVDVFDPLVLAMVGRSSNQNPFTAIKLLTGFAKDGHLVYSPTIKKWTLRVQPTEVKAPVVTKPEATAKQQTLVKKPAVTPEQPKPVLTTQEKVDPKTEILLTEDNIERTLTSFYDPDSVDGKLVRAFLTRETKNKADIEDGIADTWTAFVTTALPTIKEAVAAGRLKTTEDLRKYFVGSVKRSIRDSRKKGTSKAGLEALVKEVSKLEEDLQKAKESGKDIADIEASLYAAKFDLESFTKKTTTSVVAESRVNEGELVEKADMIPLYNLRPEKELSGKELQEFYGSWLYKVDQTIRSLLNLNNSFPVLLTEDQVKLWRYITEQGVEKADVTVPDKKGGERVKEIRVQLTDAELAKQSEKIFGRKLGASSIQTLRSDIFKKFEDLKARLRLTPKDITDSLNAVTKEIDPDSRFIAVLKEELSKDLTPPQQPDIVTPEPTSEALVKATEDAVKLVDDKAAMKAKRKPANPISVPEKTVPETKDVVFSVSDESGKPAGTPTMTSEAADKVIEVRAEAGETTTKTAIAVDKKDVIAVKDDGEVVVKDGAKKEKIGSVKVKDPDGTMSLTDKGITIEKKTVPPAKETDPAVKATKTEPAPVKPEPPPVKETPIVEEAPHINFERLVNEHKDTLRANGADVGFLAMFQKAYWKIMGKVDKGGKRTTATPLFKQLFAQYISINRAIQELNIKLFGQDKVNAFWKTVDTLRAEEAKNAITNPGYKKLSEKKLLAKAARSIHRQYQPPVLLDGDLKISLVSGVYKLKAKNVKVPQVVEPSPFPAEPKPAEAPVPPVAPTPEAPAAVPATAAAAEPTAAPATPEPPAKLPPAKESIANSLYSTANKMSMPLRMSNFIGWIFGGSNRAERNWWQKRASNLVNLIQHSSRLGDTARSNLVGIRIMAALLDGTRNVTGMLVAPGQSPIMTLLGARGVEDRVLVRIASAQLEVMKKFGGDINTINKFNTYLWTKLAKGETITEAGLVSDLGVTQTIAKDILPDILQLVDADLRTKELYLRLAQETGMVNIYDVNGNPHDPKTWMPVQVDHEKLRTIMQAEHAESALINALVEVRRNRKMGEELDVNTLIVLGWLDARAEGGDPRGSLMLRNRTFAEGFGIRKLTRETLDKLEVKGAVLGGANPSTIAAIAKHGQPKDFFVIDVNGELRAYRVPRKRADLSQADLLVYDQAVRGDTSMYLPKWQAALGNQELTRLEMIELLEHKLKRGRYMELKSGDRPLLKVQQREDVELAVPALTPSEILSDTSGAVLGMIRTNIAEAHMYFLRGRLTEMLFQRELNRLFNRNDISIDEVFDVVKDIENRNILTLSKDEKWSKSQEEAALLSLERGLKRLKEEYRYNVETLPIVEQTTSGSIAEGTLTIARMFTSPGYWLSATPEVVGALVHHYPTEWPKAFGEALKFTLGKYRASKTGLLNSPIGDMSFILQNIRTDISNRYLGEQGRGAFTVDSTFDTVWNGPRSQWDNKPMQIAERGATLGEQIGSLSQITNIARYLSKIEMQRNIYRNIKDGRIQALIAALKDPETNNAMMQYLKASQESASAERKYWKKFVGIARANKFGRDPREALFFMRYGLNTTERIKHLQWALEKVGDAEGRVDFRKLMELHEDVRRKPVQDINVNILEDVVNLYTHGIEAEILKRKTPEPYGLLKATDIESRTAIGKVILALSGWMRAFHDGRIVEYSNKSMAGMMKFIAAYAAIDGFVQILKEWLAGRDVSDIMEEMLDNPISIMQRAIHSTPLFGMFNGFFETAMSKFNTGSLFTPTMELSTPGIAVASSVVSRTDKGMSKAYKAMASGDLPEAAGYMSNVLPVASFLNKSPLAVPVKILESSVELDERNMVGRYMEVVRKDSQPYANRRNKRTKESPAFMLPAPERNVAKEAARIAEVQKATQKARAEVSGVRPDSFNINDQKGVSGILGDILGQSE